MLLHLITSRIAIKLLAFNKITLVYNNKNLFIDGLYLLLVLFKYINRFCYKNMLFSIIFSNSGHH